MTGCSRHGRNDSECTKEDTDSITEPNNALFIEVRQTLLFIHKLTVDSAVLLDRFFFGFFFNPIHREQFRDLQNRTNTYIYNSINLQHRSFIDFGNFIDSK